MNKKVKIIVLFLLMLSFILYGYYIRKDFHHDTVLSGTEITADTRDFKIISDDKIKKGETKKFVFPEYWVGFACRDSETYEDVADSMIDDWGAKKSVLNSDNTISIWLTQKKWDERVKKLEESANESLKQCWNKNLEVTISQDMQEIVYLIGTDCEMSSNGWMIHETVLMGVLFEAQALTGVPPEECKLREIVKREKDDVVIVDAVFPGGKFSFTDDQWFGPEEVE